MSDVFERFSMLMAELGQLFVCRIIHYFMNLNWRRLFSLSEFIINLAKDVRALRISVLLINSFVMGRGLRVKCVGVVFFNLEFIGFSKLELSMA